MSNEKTGSGRSDTMSAAKKALLERRLRGAGGAVRKDVIPRRTGSEPPPLSFAQQRLWFLDQLQPATAAYNVPGALRLVGALDVTALRAAINEIVRRHEALRTTFAVRGTEPRQIIAPSLVLEVPIVDLSDRDPETRDREARKLSAEEAARPFNLEHGPLVRASLLRLSASEHVLIVTLHHIVSDGWSTQVLGEELSALYGAFAAGQPSPLQELRVQYADFAAWQREWLRGPVLDAQLGFWREQLTGAPALQLPTERPRPAVQSFRGAEEHDTIPPPLADALRAFSQREGVSLFMTLLAGFAILLSRYSGQRDVVVGSPIANRTRSEIEPLIGFFVNSMALRVHLEDDPTVRGLVQRIQQVALGAFAHQDLPFERLVEELQPERDLSRNPLFQVMFALQNATGGKPLTLPGLELSFYGSNIRTTRFDLELHVWERPQDVRTVAIYSADVFDGPAIHRLLVHYRTILEGMMADPDRRASRVEMMQPDERQHIVHGWNQTAVADTAPLVLAQVAEQAAVRPDALALQHGERTMTYAELDARANQVARLLREHGVRSEQRVVLVLERSIELAVAALGVMKAGGAYVPLDPAYPADRLAFAIEDTRTPVVLTQPALAPRVEGRGAPVVRLDATWRALEGIDASAVEASIEPGHLAYVIYTSGSTGRPKGVEVPHGGLRNLVAWHRREYAITPADRATLLAGVGFDASVWELWPYLTAGASVHVVEPETTLDPAVLWNWVKARGITVSFMPTPLAEAALRAQVPQGLALRVLLTGGDRLQHGAPASLPFAFINHYGPTENSVVATACAVAAAQGSDSPAPPIGRPIHNVQAYVLDAYGDPVPAGIPGELYIGGESLARGYMHRADLTAERFVPDPFGGRAGARLYRTGDLVRSSSDGNLQFLGRNDQQVKVRGFRIELGEIETVIGEHTAVSETVVVARQDATGESQLTAYVVADADRISLEAEVAEGWDSDHVKQWQTLYEHTYDQTAAQADAGFNIIGWNSSYTGRPIPEAEMREWVDATVDRILELGPRRVLEIGCGTGLLLSRVAGRVERYAATDFSAVAVQQIRRQIAAREDLRHVEVLCRTADDFSGFEPGSFDTVVINSVVQYLPGVDYLVRVLQGAIGLVAEGGRIFVGDVRNFPLLPAYHASVKYFAARDAMTLAELQKSVTLAVAAEEELTIDPALFAALRDAAPRLTGVRVLLKRGRFHNELSRFRYDVVLEVGGSRADTAARVLDWDADHLNIWRLRDLLRHSSDSRIVVSGVPNARIAADAAVLAALREQPATATVGDVRAEIPNRVAQAIDPAALWDVSDGLPYAVEVTYGAPGHPDQMIVQYRRVDSEGGAPPSVAFSEHRPGSRPWATYVNDPLRPRRKRELIRQLQRVARKRLPEYMVPAGFMLLDRLPLTPNGKTDRAALATAPAYAVDPVEVVTAGESIPAESQTGESRTESVAALERKIASVWKEVLGVERVGVDTNFFDLGGHSLRLVQVQRLLRETHGIEISAVDLFKMPTVASLARHLAGGDEPRPEALVPAGASLAPKADDAIAIIGMSGRFPGAASIEAFWANLRDGVESIRRFSDDELRAAGIDESVLQNPRYVKAYGAVDDADMFDAGFFGYAPREAELIDPQQRLFLECAWEGLERAGYDPQTYGGSVGVYAGSSTSLYMMGVLSRASVLASGGGLQAIIGGGSDFLATRTSYKLDLRGPSVNIQTACSTSLVAVHEACRSLLSGECGIALAGGSTIRVPLVGGYVYQEEGIASPDGHCRAFDAGARGTVGGSGVAVVVLKRLSQAIADGDNIEAVIRGTAINNDGSLKVGYTAPSVQGQAAVIAAAHQRAGVEPETIGYIEAHGTGTALGDPIEVDALRKAFGDRAASGSCAIGSVKTNVGHLDAAAGVTGLIKAALALRTGELPPSLNFDSPNPKVDFGSSPFYVNDRLRSWPAGPAPRRAGVSSFGIGGTNAHAVLEEAPPREPSAKGRPTQLVVLSARTAAALEQATDRLADWLDANRNASLADVAFTLQVGRKRLAHRRMLVATDAASAAAALRARDSKQVITRQVDATDGGAAFLFPGQGVLTAGVGRGLYATEPVFRSEVDRCAELLAPEIGADLRRLLHPAAEETSAAQRTLEDTAIGQPALFSVEYALARLWMSWGVTPRAMLGHSLGEYVAACIAGVIALEDALRLVAARGRLMQGLPRGAMLAVSLDEAAVRARLDGSLDIAAVNGPSATVVSGTVESVDAFERALAADRVASRRLATERAFHSAMVEPISGAFRELIQRVQLSAPRVPYVSNVTGTWIAAAEATDPEYWVRHLREAVQFSAGIATLLEDPDCALIEVGPGQTLSALARRAAGGGDRVRLASVPADAAKEDDGSTMLASLGQLWMHGVRVDWRGVSGHERRHRVVLPTAPFERQRYWIDPARASAAPEDRRLTKRSDVASWFYAPGWAPAPLPEAASRATAGAQSRWLILRDGLGLGTQLASRLAARGHDVVVVRAGAAFEKTGDGEYIVNPSSRADYDRLFGDLSRVDRLPDRIVHGWSLAGDTEDATDALESAKRNGYYALVYLLQALIAHAPGRQTAVAVVTDALHAVSAGERVSPGKALLLGPSRVASLEQPNLSCRTVDVQVPAAGSWQRDRLVDQLVAELSSDSANAGVAYRGTQRYVERFDAVRLGASADASLPFRQHGVYLITGGFGQIGLVLAAHLARTCGARLALLARSVPDAGRGTQPERLERIREIERLGGEVFAVAADVADPAALRQAIERVEQRFGRIDGVVHAAAVLDPSTLRALDRIESADSERQFDPKVGGVAALEVALGERPLDFCVLMSSVSTVLGAFGAGAYVSANAYLDSFAHEHNRRSPVPWISVGWDAWSVRDDEGAPKAGAAALAMTAAEGMQAFSHILGVRHAGRIAVSTGDLSLRIGQQRAGSGPASEDDGATAELHERPALSAAYVAPKTDTEEAIAGIWQALLGIDRIGSDDNFFELGGHSLLALQLIFRIREVFDVDLSVHAIFNAPTVAQLAALVEQSGGHTRGALDRLDEALKLVEDLPEEEIRSLLAAAGEAEL